MYRLALNYMNIKSAKFVKSLIGTDEVLEDGTPQIAFIGRSNVGKSSVINSLVNEKNLARTSSFPGRTQEINVYVINKALYLIDIPGYGYAKASWEKQEQIEKLIYWYLMDSGYSQKKVIFIIDASVGPTDQDIKILRDLEKRRKNIVIVANKIDKIKKSAYMQQLKKIKTAVGKHAIIPYSAKKHIGISKLTEEILK